MDDSAPKSSKRQRADSVKPYRCKNLIAVIENPHDIKNIGTVVRNVNALGVEKTYIVDMHGERWDVTQAMSIGFEPRRFRHGIGRNAFTPLDDSSLSQDTSDARMSQRVIGVSDGKDANAYSVSKLYHHETANSFLGDAPITAAY